MKRTALFVALLGIAACGDASDPANPCAADQVFIGGACTTPGPDEVVCDTSGVPAHAIPLLALASTVHPCDWVCDSDYFELGGACVNQRQVPCDDVAPQHATSTVLQVTVGYTTAGGFAAPALCSWSCDTDYFDTGDDCINEDTALCTDNPPSDATSIFADVPITYTTAGGWSTPADCAWECNPGFRQVGVTCVDAPVVVSVTPSNGGSANGVGPIQIIFSEPMNTASVQAAFQLTPSDPVTFEWDANASILLAIPDTTFVNQQSYTVQIHAGAADLANNPIAAPVASTFYGDDWVMFYGSDGTTTGDLITRAGGLTLANSTARIAADALCGAAAFATKPSQCTNGSGAFISVNGSDQARDLLVAKSLVAHSEVRTPTDEILEPTWEALFDGNVQLYMEYHGFYGNSTHLWWTGSNVDGTFNSGPQETACNNWTNGTVSYFGQHGWPHSTDYMWIARAGIACQNAEHLLCMCW